MNEWTEFDGYEYRVIDHNNGRNETWSLEFKDKKIPPMDILEKICKRISYLWSPSIIPYPEKGIVYYSGWID